MQLRLIETLFLLFLYNCTQRDGTPKDERTRSDQHSKVKLQVYANRIGKRDAMIVTVLAFCDGNKVITTVRTKITGVVLRSLV
jgi:inosine/xanthosine triphosphate pyrophosphatase family protein